MLHLIYHYLSEFYQSDNVIFWDFFSKQYKTYPMAFFLFNVISATFSVFTLVIALKHVRGTAKINRVYMNMREFTKK